MFVDGIFHINKSRPSNVVCGLLPYLRFFLAVYNPHHCSLSASLVGVTRRIVDCFLISSCLFLVSFSLTAVWSSRIGERGGRERGGRERGERER